MIDPPTSIQHPLLLLFLQVFSMLLRKCRTSSLLIPNLAKNRQDESTYEGATVRPEITQAPPSQATPHHATPLSLSLSLCGGVSLSIARPGGAYTHTHYRQAPSPSHPSLPSLPFSGHRAQEGLLPGAHRYAGLRLPVPLHHAGPCLPKGQRQAGGMQGACSIRPDQIKPSFHSPTR